MLNHGIHYIVSMFRLEMMIVEGLGLYILNSYSQLTEILHRVLLTMVFPLNTLFQDLGIVITCKQRLASHSAALSHILPVLLLLS